jgi:hypothetical protein
MTTAAPAFRALFIGAFGLILMWIGSQKLKVVIDARVVALYVLIPAGLMFMAAGIWHLSGWFVKDVAYGDSAEK